MSTRRRLWQILGPVLIAGILLAGGLMVPWHYGRLSDSTVDRAAVSMSPDVFLGARIKQQAVRSGYVPLWVPRSYRGWIHYIHPYWRQSTTVPTARC